MRISVFGLGYVGGVTAGCLAHRGHDIWGVDVQPAKAADFASGVPPIVEPGLDRLLQEAAAAGRLHGTTDAVVAVAATEVSIVCVGTPSALNGALDLGHVRGVLRDIAAAVRGLDRPHALVLRSTMLPGSTAALVQELAADLVAAGRLGVFYLPEFLREGTAVADFEQPSLAVVGTRGATEPSAALCEALFGHQAAVVTWEAAELVKYACNAFHAAKVTFANEVGRLGKALGVDAREVMRLICQDTRLNISPYYLRPGNPFGGSCLPKDVRALTHRARVEGLSLPLLENLLPSNERHLQALLALVAAHGGTDVALLGLSFKEHTDDLRESPMVEVAQALLGRGHRLRIYDPALNLAALVGANKRVIDLKMPHLAGLLKPTAAEAVGDAGLVIVAQKCVPAAELPRLFTPQHVVLDVNGWPELAATPARYVGFCW